MTKLRNSDTAIIDRVAAVETIRKYFIEKQSPKSAKKHIEGFRADLKYKTGLIKERPKLYAVRDDGWFKDSLRKFRSFAVHWFIVFYTYEVEDDEVVIWYIRSAKSDYSNVLFLDQSRTT
ncbi:MAG: hypothetical protein LBS91_09255 [Clostridiales Family XIII bacterium]|jgi:plasmid stabilization system protein ParE|nr:hypothetical protein [Clostridiales Family XIII bacterium]